MGGAGGEAITTASGNGYYTNAGTIYGANDAVNALEVTYEIIGGGGTGAGGYYGTGNGRAGGNSTISSVSGTSFSTITATGGAGGTQPAPIGWNNYRVSQNGYSSYYGAGGQGGYNSNSDNQSAGFAAPSGSYGAGGGGGGAYPFSANNGGGGGRAGTRKTGTLTLQIGSVIRITIGAKGSGHAGGGNGAKGYAKITANGSSTNFYSTGNYTVTA